MTRTVGFGALGRLEKKDLPRSLEDFGEWLEESNFRARESGRKESYEHIKQYITLSIRKSKSKDAILKFLNRQIRRC